MARAFYLSLVDGWVNSLGAKDEEGRGYLPWGCMSYYFWLGKQGCIAYSWV